MGRGQWGGGDGRGDAEGGNGEEAMGREGKEVSQAH